MIPLGSGSTKKLATSGGLLQRCALHEAGCAKRDARSALHERGSQTKPHRSAAPPRSK
jgi:hypothetical protein